VMEAVPYTAKQRKNQREATMNNAVLHLGDCLNVMREMDSGSVDAVITDPPYSSGGQFRGDRTGSTLNKYVQTGSVDTWRQPFSGDNRDQRGFIVWCSMWMGEARRLTKPGGLIACFTDWRQLPTVTDAMQCGGWVWRGIATWWKPGIRMQRGRFSLSAEYVVFGSNGEVNEGENSPQNVFSCAPVGGDDKNHIAEKPISVLNWIVGVTPKGSTVLDPFMGSGTTGLACAHLGRKFIGIELDPLYYEISSKRIREGQMPLWEAAND
jgi:site-specific DNA-methyltransferase (adenine-specific)